MKTKDITGKYAEIGPFVHIIEVDRLFLSECLARLDGLISAYEQEQTALRKYFDTHDVEHSEDDCPQDDTCGCAENIQLAVAWDNLAHQVILAYRRTDKIRALLK